jgi:hypothetical protein
MAAYHLFAPADRRRPFLRGFSGLLFAAAFVGSALACVRELTPEENAFYKRAASIEVGTTLERVRRELGSPSRILNPGEDCVSKGGRKEWLYDSFESEGARKPLRAGSYCYCADENSAVVAIFRIVS